MGKGRALAGASEGDISDERERKSERSITDCRPVIIRQIRV